MMKEEREEFSAVCPACESDPNARQYLNYDDSDAENRALYNCVNCGPFKIDHMTYTDVKMNFSGEVCGPEGRKRFRDLIKKRQKAEACPEINGKEVEAIANDPTLPKRL